jgi:hypothetical protein
MPPDLGLYVLLSLPGWWRPHAAILRPLPLHRFNTGCQWEDMQRDLYFQRLDGKSDWTIVADTDEFVA